MLQFFAILIYFKESYSGKNCGCRKVIGFICTEAMYWPVLGSGNNVSFQKRQSNFKILNWVAFSEQIVFQLVQTCSIEGSEDTWPAPPDTFSTSVSSLYVGHLFSTLLSLDV